MKQFDNIRNLVRPEFWICFVLLAAIISVYYQIHNFPFIAYDTPEYVYDNPIVKNGISHNGIIWALTTTYFANWHPLTWMSHMLDVQIYGLNAGNHHINNLILHIVNTFLLFLLINILTGKLYHSGFIAGMFALHPLHIQSVVWIAERKDLLSSLFCFLALIAYAKYVRSLKLSRYLLVLLLFILGLMSKPMLVTLPFVLLLLDYYPLARFHGLLAINPVIVSPKFSSIKQVNLLFIVLEKVPFLVLSLASSLITIYAQKTSGAMASITQISIGERLGNAAISYTGYILKMFWPVELAIIYPYPESFSIIQVTFSTFFLVIISFLVIRFIKVSPWYAVGWFFYLGTLVPVIGIIQVGVQAMADRYTYLPMIGLFIMISCGLSVGTTKLFLNSKAFFFAAIFLLVIASAITTYQLKFWKNGVLLFNRAIELTNNNYTAHNNLGYELIRNGQYLEAAEQCRRAIQIKPAYAPAYFNLGTSLVHLGEFDEGISQYNIILKLYPSYKGVHYNLGNALLCQGKYNQAVPHLLKEIELYPDYANSYSSLGLIMLIQDDIEKAIMYLKKAIELQPDLYEAHVNLKIALKKKK